MSDGLYSMGTEELGIIKKRKQMEYLDDINQRFKKKPKPDGDKKKFIYDTIIHSFHELQKISIEDNINDGVIILINSYNLGLRDSKDEDWNTKSIEQELINTIKTLSQFHNRKVMKVTSELIVAAKKRYPNIKIPSRIMMWLKHLFIKELKLFNRRGDNDE